jgi:hypothetical protein
MNETPTEEDPRLSSRKPEDDHLTYEIERAQRLIHRLIAEGKSGEKEELYIGIEGGSVSERVIQALLDQADLSDLRESEPKTPPPDDTQARAMYESTTPLGVTFRLTRIHIDDGAPLLQLEVEKH